MFKRDWGNGFASGLIVFACLAGVAFTLVSIGHDGASHLADYPNQSSNTSNQCGDGNEPVWGPWFGLCFGLYDSLAQWVMMAFTVVAAGLLLGTLYEANKTNVAVLHANQIMRDEQRPWLTIHPGEYIGPDMPDANGIISFEFDYMIVNEGKTPAFNVSARVYAFLHDSDMAVRDHVSKLLDNAFIPEDAGVGPLIFPSQEVFDQRAVYTLFLDKTEKRNTSLILRLVYAVDQDRTLAADIRCFRLKSHWRDGTEFTGTDLIEIPRARVIK